jgi:TolB-like protein/Tfp pilus assembly protein PilF
LSIFKELKRRNVFKVGIAYAVTIWVLLQLTDTIAEILALPEWAPKLVLLLLVIGFVPALILAWAFELTPDGIKLEKDVVRQKSITPKTGRKLDYVIIISLGLSLGYFIWESRFEQKTAAFEATLSDETGQQIEPKPPLPAVPESSQNIDANSIAVLPFANRSMDSEDTYFTDGIHDDLLTQLSKVEAFSIISRTSVMEYRDTTKNLREIARELSVANIMEGSVQRSGDRVRINVQLIDAKTDEHLWAEIYDRELTANNLFDIQSEIALAIATALKATLTDSELASVTDVPTENVAAYDLYLQAKRFVVSETRLGYQTNAELLTESLKLDPEFKLAWTGLARTHMANYWFYGGKISDREMALDAIEKARSIDASFAELFVAEAIYWYWGFHDYERALYNLDKAIGMMPGNSEAYMWRGWVSRRAGLWDDALQSMQNSLKLNPRVHFNWHEYAITEMYLHHYAKAREAAQKSLELDSDSFWARTTLAKVLLQEKGDIQTAVELTVGVQHSDDYDFFEAYINTRLMSRKYEEALQAARNLSVHQEIQRDRIVLREAESARVLHYMGRLDEARLAADAALFRLKGFHSELGRDYRTDLAEAMIGAIRGLSGDKLITLINSSIATTPADEVARFQVGYLHAQIYAIAGMAAEAVEKLAPVLQAPSETSIFMVDLDPAFDAIRQNPEFASLLDKYRQLP